MMNKISDELINDEIYGPILLQIMKRTNSTTAAKALRANKQQSICVFIDYNTDNGRFDIIIYIKISDGSVSLCHALSFL